MLKLKESEILKLSSVYKLALPPVLTSEELFLKSKYEELKKAKSQLMPYKATVNSTSTIKKIVNVKATNLKKQSEISSKKTTDFQHWSKQAQNVLAKRTLPVNIFKEDSEPRSVKIQGEDLTDEYLHKHFNKFGCILKIRTSENKTRSVLTFKQPMSAVKSVEALNGSLIDGVRLEVSILRKNNSWRSMENNSYLVNKKNNGKSVHLSYKGHLTVDDFEDFFREVGRITRIYINEAKHFSFVTFENEEQANRAIRERNGEFCKGSKVFVSAQILLDGTHPKQLLSPVSEHQEREMMSYDDLEA